MFKNIHIINNISEFSLQNITNIYNTEDNYITIVAFSSDESFFVFDEISQEKIKLLYLGSYHYYKYNYLQKYLSLNAFKYLKYIVKYF